MSRIFSIFLFGNSYWLSVGGGGTHTEEEEGGKELRFLGVGFKCIARCECDATTLGTVSSCRCLSLVSSAKNVP